ncbi:MAG: hypothetical protein ACLP9K_04905 [Nitrososphaerales archaeon]
MRSRRYKSKTPGSLTDVFGTPINRERELQPAKFAKDVEVLEEPVLEFRYRQRLEDPRDGLTLFGPHDWEEKFHVSKISYGLVGPEGGNAKFLEFVKLLHLPSVHDTDPLKLRLWPPFPGFEIAFDCELPSNPTRTFQVDEEPLLKDSRQPNAYDRAFDVAGRYLEGIVDVKKGEEPINVVVCVVPEEVYRNCRPTSVVDSQPARTAVARQGVLDEEREGLMAVEDTTAENFSPDFRRQLKARSMGEKLPIQIIRDTTLKLGDEFVFGERGLTPLSDRAWNISTTLYYKAGGKPWILATAREGVCYVGLVYKRVPRPKGAKTACCAAQMFLDDGDGVVFRSEFGPWYSPETHEMHLDPAEATSLLKKVLGTYQRQQGKKPLKEVFLHYRSTMERDEYEAFSAACPPDVKVVAIRVRTDRNGVRLYREGAYPILRGTFWRVNDSTCYLWASGFKPRLATYDGSEVPAPLRIDIQHGTADLKQVAKDILGLTKLNYNECKYGDASPVTIGFSDAVGEILVSNPTIKDPDPRFRYYI